MKFYESFENGDMTLFFASLGFFKEEDKWGENSSSEGNASWEGTEFRWTSNQYMMQDAVDDTGFFSFCTKKNPAYILSCFFDEFSKKGNGDEVEIFSWGSHFDLQKINICIAFSISLLARILAIYQYIFFMDYIRNSKNRKLKTQILGFFIRLNFGTYRLGLPGKAIIFCLLMLAISLFFPWIIFKKPLSAGDTYYSAFSLYVGGVGFGIIISIILILFFLLSHEKKERFRAYVPFRLSDAQAIVFVASLLGVAILSFTIASFAYTRISSQEVVPGMGLKLAISSIFLLYVGAYFFSQGEKTRAVSMSYLDKKEHTELDEYKDILEGGNHSGEKKKEGNMTLPI